MRGDAERDGIDIAPVGTYLEAVGEGIIAPAANIRVEGLKRATSA